MFEQSTNIDEDKMLEKLYSMIKTSLSINKVENRIELLKNFEKVTKDIETREEKKYEIEIQEKFYTTTSLEDERKRLSSLIVIITDRINRRSILKREYEIVSGQTLMGLPDIPYSNNLEEYKERLNLICSYLDNEKEVETIKKELTFLSSQLEKEIEIKKNFEVVNSKLEEKLLNNFKNIIAGNKYYSSLSTDDIDKEVKNAEIEAKEKEEKLNAFILAYESIKNESITSNHQLDEYSNYIIEIKNLYYSCVKKVVFLKTYKLVNEIKISTEDISNKRILIKKILEELTSLKMKLKIDEPNLLFDFYMLVKEQDIKVSNAVDNVHKINQIKDKIEFYSNKVESLEEIENNEKMVAILKEYGMIVDKEEKIENTESNFFDTFDSNSVIQDVSISNNHSAIDTFNFEIPEEFEVSKPKTYLPNEIKQVLDLPPKMNISMSRAKAINVLTRVCERLGVKKIKVVKPVVNNEFFSANLSVNTQNMSKIEENSNIVANKEFDNINIPSQNIEFNMPNIETSKKEESEVPKSIDNNQLMMPEFEYSSFWNDNGDIANTDFNDSGAMPNLPE